MREKLEFEFVLKFRNLRFKFLYLSPSHFLEFSILFVMKEVLGVLKFGDGFFIAMSTLEDTFQVVVFAVEAHIPGLVCNDRGVSNKQTDLMELSL